MPARTRARIKIKKPRRFFLGRSFAVVQPFDGNLHITIWTPTMQIMVTRHLDDYKVAHRAWQSIGRADLLHLERNAMRRSTMPERRKEDHPPLEPTLSYPLPE